MNFDPATRNPGVAVLLTLSGGYLDAFAYVGHGGVFANTMTGNVALLGVSIAASDWAQADRHLPPLLAFVVAVLANHLLRRAHVAGRRWAREPALTCLALEIGFLALAASGLVPVADAWLIPGISFVATLQTLAFTHLEEIPYTSVMTTGNLRRSAQALFDGLIPRRKASALRESRLLGMIGLSFLIGAIGGAFFTRHGVDSALWVVVGMLTAALLRILQVARRAVTPDRETRD